jgi:hypothetical protein
MAASNIGVEILRARSLFGRPLSRRNSVDVDENKCRTFVVIYPGVAMLFPPINPGVDRWTLAEVHGRGQTRFRVWRSAGTSQRRT